MNTNPTCMRISKHIEEAREIAKQIPFQPNISEYLHTIYRVLKDKMTGTDFLLEVECSETYKLFEHILNDSKRFTVENVSEKALSMAQPGYVFQIRLTSLFASYHFITVVFGPSMEFVDVYQSYGSTMRLHHKRLPMRVFDRCITILSNIKRKGKNFITDFQNMLFVERELFGINIETYMETKYQEFKQNGDEYPLDYTAKERQQYASIGILDPEFGEDMKTAYELSRGILSIREYKAKPTSSSKNGGRKRNRTKKRLKY